MSKELSVQATSGLLDAEMYLARKVLVRNECFLGNTQDRTCESRLEPAFFCDWIGENEAICVPTASISLFSQKTKKIPRNSSNVIAKNVFFLYPSLAESRGLRPHANQDLFFPEKIPEIRQCLNILSPCEAHTSIHENRILKGLKSTIKLTTAEFERLPVIGRGIEICRSQIPRAGRGLFASRDFRDGELITSYFGHVFAESLRPHLKGKLTHCIPLLQKFLYLDGVAEPFLGIPGGQFINHGNKGAVNCIPVQVEILPVKQAIALRATRDIRRGEEFYFSYGSNFWRELNIEAYSREDHPAEPTRLRGRPVPLRLGRPGRPRILHRSDDGYRYFARRP